MPEARTGKPADSDDGGLLGKIIVGTATAVFGAYIIAHYINGPAEQKRSELDQKQRQADREAQKKADEYKIRAQQRADVVRNIEQHDEKNRNLAQDLKGKYFTLNFDNTCGHQSLNLAVRYEELDGMIYVKGWYHLNPRESVSLKDVHTKESWFDFYTDPPDPKLEGKDAATVSMPPKTFEYIENSSYAVNGMTPLEDENRKVVNFTSVRISRPTYGVFTYRLSCPPSPLRRLPRLQLPRDGHSIFDLPPPPKKP